jgi:hypothetical protein
MALKIECETCSECAVFFDGGCGYSECRLNPPIPISQYASAYPTVRASNPGCSCGCRLVVKKVVKRGKSKE